MSRRTDTKIQDILETASKADSFTVIQLAKSAYASQSLVRFVLHKYLHGYVQDPTRRCLTGRPPKGGGEYHWCSDEHRMRFCKKYGLDSKLSEAIPYSTSDSPTEVPDGKKGALTGYVMEKVSKSRQFGARIQEEGRFVYDTVRDGMMKEPKEIVTREKANKETYQPPR